MGLQIKGAEAFQDLSLLKVSQCKSFITKGMRQAKCLSNYLAFLKRKCQPGFKKELKRNLEQNIHVLLWVFLALKLYSEAETIWYPTPLKPRK